MSGKNNNSDDGCMTFLTVALLAIFAMPIVGAFLLITGKDEKSKLLGLVLLIIGIVFWLATKN